MIKVERRLILAGLIVVLLQLENVSTAPKENTVSQLMMSSADKSTKFGLLNYFKDLGLDNLCNFPLLDVNNFKTVETEYAFKCFCTVIYNISNEIKYSLVNDIDLEIAKNITNKHKFKDETMYGLWKNVTEFSQPMKLLMDPLDNITKWNKVCYNLNNELHTYCKFLNVEVLLLKNTRLEKSRPSLKENIDNPSINLKEPVLTSAVIEEPKKTEDLPQIKVDKSPENMINADINQKSVVINNKDSNNDEELPAEIPKVDNANIEDDETTTEDEKQIEEIDAQTPIDSKLDSKSSDDYPKESDGTINQSETKEIVSRLGPKPKFSNRAFDDTEDSHFLFYFSIMTILSMLFYLALYNKKKIIALLIEGRQSTNHRRRPNTSSYSKVETEDGSTVF
ncbi:PREDICTED: putative DNA helicase INO80 [Diuraphis noxia]|uniref:putative DNA helicase INO80 n=1 Tax=Diuraphis noxia TaxID=143948 RepID=UPI000763AF21|nr:PREDICTED: putative DNA helicase INO80 [Diuraphis noxia]